MRQVRAVIYLGTPAQGVGEARLGRWLSFNSQLQAMEPASLNQWISELEDDWIRLMDERGESQYPRAFCVHEIRPYVLGYVVVPREAAYSRCDTFTGLDLNHSDLAVPRDRQNDQYEWTMAAILRTSDVSVNIDDIKLQVLFECDLKTFVKMIPAEGGPKIIVFSPASHQARRVGGLQELGIPGKENSFADPERNGGRGHVCQLTSYEKYPLLNIELDFQLRFKETPEQTVMGAPIISELLWTSVIEKLEPGERVVFYLINYSDCYLEAEFPNWIYFVRLGEFQRRTVRLSTIRGRGIALLGPWKYPVPPEYFRCR